MIYFDNSATTLEKPPEVAQALADSLAELGNPGRSFHQPSMLAARTVLAARQAIAQLTGCQTPLSVAFTSGATESLNLVIASLISPEDHVITTALEHNSVLRPLYRQGCDHAILPCDDQGELCLDQLPGLLRPNSKFLLATHGSNLLGNITPVEALRDFCRDHGLIFILDVSQTLGSVPVSVSMAHILCFTGHKALMGPQGTGGIITEQPLDFSLVKTGGSGSDSFSPHQSLEFPDVFEAGTPNTHGLAGLVGALSALEKITLEAIQKKEHRLLTYLLQGLKEMPEVRIYGNPQIPPQGRLPVVAMNLGEHSAEALSCALWEGWEIATRPGSHCAPLVHQHFATERRGMLRLSLGYYNTQDQIDTLFLALKTLESRRL